MQRHIIIIGFIISTGLISCSKFLDRKPIDFVSPDNFSTENDITLALNGNYKALMIDRLQPICLDFMTDNGFVEYAPNGEIDFWIQAQNPNSLCTKRKWDRNYAGILRANTILKYIDGVPMDAAKKKRYTGEAFFLRAYFYTDLLEFYGDVPYRKEPEGLDKKDAPRVDKKIILEDMLRDLDSAAAWMPKTPTETGRATKGAALAIKARVLLNNRRWQEAADATKAVMDLNVYDLFNNYGTLFMPENEYNKEIIFDLPYIKNQNDNGLSSPWYTFFYSWSSYMGLANLEREYYMTNGKPIADPTSGYAPQNPFVNRDPRLGFNFTLPYTMNGYATNGSVKNYIPDQSKGVNVSSLRIRKYVDYRDNNINNNSEVNVNIMRFADVLLMRAEALAELPDWQSYKTEIIGLVNRVRQRATVMMPKVENVEGTNLTQEQLRNIIRHERRVEFAFEGTRIDDIKRWDIGATAYTDALGYRPEKLKTAQATAVYELYAFKQRSFNTNKGYLWPIPLSEMQSNTAIPQNNPGY